MRKVLLGVITGLFLLTVVVTGVHAANDNNRCENTGNGRNSKNRCRITATYNWTKVQQNNTAIMNSVNVNANTGGNKVKDNIDGDSKANTGDINTTVSITNTVTNSN
ncbi:hypothetical protein HGA91_06500 [candidate division WWE3 bacterium]|nr:hypothetical protein [candidate division WWE3 bacterium]